MARGIIETLVGREKNICSQRKQVQNVDTVVRQMEVIDLFVHCKSFLFIEEDCFLFCSAGTSVTRVTATDADDPVYGNSARLVYSILEGQPYFSIDQSTGKLINPQYPDGHESFK